MIWYNELAYKKYTSPPSVNNLSKIVKLKLNISCKINGALINNQSINKCVLLPLM